MLIIFFNLVYLKVMDTTKSSILIVLVVLIYLVSVYFINTTFIGTNGILIFNLHNAKNINCQADTNELTFKRLISDEYADNLANRVMKLQKHWRKKNPVMYTLGIGSYSEDDYHSKVLKSNELLENNFQDLYKILLDYFTQLYPDSQVKYRPDCGLPGFHIFICNKLFSYPISSVHTDKQWRKIRHYPHEDLDIENTFSFTLTVQLPKSGGGLYIFKDIKPSDSISKFIPNPILYNLAQKEKINYRKGHFVLHTGNTTHMIAHSNFSGEEKGDETQYRITLQCHGIYDKNNDIWWIYW